MTWQGWVVLGVLVAGILAVGLIASRQVVDRPARAMILAMSIASVAISVVLWILLSEL